MRNTKNWKLEDYIRSITSITQTKCVYKGNDFFIVERMTINDSQRYHIVINEKQLLFYTTIYEGDYIGSIDRKKYSRENARSIFGNFENAKDKETYTLIQELKVITKLLEVDGNNTKRQAMKQLKEIIKREES